MSREWMPMQTPEQYSLPEIFCPFSTNGQCPGGCSDMNDRACIVGLDDE